MKKELVGPAMTDHQISITEIPRKLYEHFYPRRLGNSIKTETSGEIRVWFELPIDSAKDTDEVVAIFTELSNGDSLETKFALSPGIPADEHYRDSYHFEIAAGPESGGWTYGKGNSFTEAISYTVKKDAIYADHVITDYIAEALIKMRKLLKDEKIVRQKFIDHAQKPPR